MNSPFATGKYTVAGMHARPRRTAPLRSQLLLGEPVRLLERVGDYRRVRRAQDGLEAFVLSDQLLAVSESLYLKQRDQPTFVLDLFTTVLADHYGMPVTFGARLPEYDGLQASHGNQRYRYSGQAVSAVDLRLEAELLLRQARKWLYVPELRGGRTPVGIDAVSLVQLLLRLANVRLPPTAEAMVRCGRPVDFVVQCQSGDLAFFDDGRGRIDHVGLVLPDGEVLHVRGRVRIDGLDHCGIFDREHRRYTHRLRIVRRCLPDRQVDELALSENLATIGPPTRQPLLF